MIINFYLPESDQKIVETLRQVSGQKKRSFSFVVREALEYYLLNFLRMKEQDLHQLNKED